MEKRCSVCGHMMQTDSFTGRLICSSCGNELEITAESVQGTYEDARSLVNAGKYDSAQKILNGMDDSCAEVILLNLLCCYQVNDVESLLARVSSSPSELQILAARKDIDRLAKMLPRQKNKLIIHMLEYCSLGLQLSGIDINAFRIKRISNKPQRNKSMSAFAKMDAEEEYNDARVKMLREASEPPKKEYKDLADLMNDYLDTPPRHSYGNDWEEPADSLEENIVLDLMDLFISDDFYSPEPLSHVRRYRTQNLKPENTGCPVSNNASGSKDKSMTPEEMRSRRSELLKLIRDEEKQILSNAGPKRVVVRPYDETWKTDFIAIRDELNPALEGLVLRIEHVGSTSVEGLSAKPVIDIDVVIQDRSILPDVISALQKIGYRHEGDLGIPGRDAFKYEGKEHLRKHHLYVCSQDSEELRRHIAFRDYLRSNPDAVAEYSRIKEEGASLYPWNIEKYIEYKAPFIETVYRNIGLL